MKKHQQVKKQLPVEKKEDVEFCMEQADAADLQALRRAEAADVRQRGKGG